MQVRKKSKEYKKAIWSTARTDYVKWITDPRMIIVVVLLIFIYQVAVGPLTEMSVDMGEPLNILEPFIAVANSPLLLLLIPLVFLTLISDFPRTDGNTMFFIHRIGRVSWMWGQLLFIVMALATYILVLLLGTTIPVFFQSSFSTLWSLPVRQYYLHFPDKSGSFAAQLITGHLYNQVPPVEAAVLTYLLMSMYLLLISLILLLFWLLKRKGMGIFAAAMVVGIGTAASMIGGKAMWLLPMANANVWMHYTELERAMVCPFWYSWLYFLVWIVLLTVVCIRLVGRYNFLNVTEID